MENNKQWKITKLKCTTVTDFPGKDNNDNIIFGLNLHSGEYLKIGFTIKCY